MIERPVYQITLRPEVGIDGARALRQLLKVAGRAFGLQCVGAVREQASEAISPPGSLRECAAGRSCRRARRASL